MSIGRAEVLITQANRYLDEGDIEMAKIRLRDARDEFRTFGGKFITLDSDEQKAKDALINAFYTAVERLPGDGSIDGLGGR